MTYKILISLIVASGLILFASMETEAIECTGGQSYYQPAEKCLTDEQIFWCMSHSDIAEKIAFEICRGDPNVSCDQELKTARKHSARACKQRV